MQTLIEVEHQPNLFRDKETNMILNSDSSSYNQRLKIKAAAKAQADEVENIHKDISEIRTILNSIVTIIQAQNHGKSNTNQASA